MSMKSCRYAYLLARSATAVLPSTVGFTGSIEKLASMHALVFRSDASPASELRQLLRHVALVPSPAIEGLRARYWRAGRRRFWGRYLFDRADQAECFARAPAADPAFGLVAAHVPSTSSTVCHEEIPDVDWLDGPIFIISAPRAGSTLLYELLANSEHLWTIDGESEGIIEGIPQLHLANRGFDSHRLTDADADVATIQALQAGFAAELLNFEGQRFLELARESPSPRVRMLEKTTENSLRVSFLATSFKSAKFVFLHRDGRQSVNSILEAWQHDGFVNIPALPDWPRGHWNFLLPEGWRNLRDSSLLEIAAYQWNAANQCSLHDLEGLERERWMSVDYNELVVSPDAV